MKNALPEPPWFRFGVTSDGDVLLVEGDTGPNAKLTISQHNGDLRMTLLRGEAKDPLQFMVRGHEGDGSRREWLDAEAENDSTALQTKECTFCEEQITVIPRTTDPVFQRQQRCFGLRKDIEAILTRYTAAIERCTSVTKTADETKLALSAALTRTPTFQETVKATFDKWQSELQDLDSWQRTATDLEKQLGAANLSLLELATVDRLI